MPVRKVAGHRGHAALAMVERHVVAAGGHGHFVPIHCQAVLGAEQHGGNAQNAGAAAHIQHARAGADIQVANV